MALEPLHSLTDRLKQHVNLLDSIGDDGRQSLSLDADGAQILADDIAAAIKRLERIARDLQHLVDEIRR